LTLQRISAEQNVRTGRDITVQEAQRNTYVRRSMRVAENEGGRTGRTGELNAAVNERRTRTQA